MHRFRQLLITLMKNLVGLFGRHSTSYHAERHYMRGPGPACERKKSHSA
jgi:hypothetical protein